MMNYLYEPDPQLQVIAESRKKHSAISLISKAVSTPLTLQALANAAVDKIAEIIDVDVILLFAPEDGESKLQAYRGCSVGFTRRASKIGLGDKFNGLALQTGEPLFLDNSRLDSNSLQGILSREGLMSLFIVPLKSGDEVLGTLSVAKRCSKHFTAEEKDLLGIVGFIIGNAVEKIRYHNESNLATKKFQELFEKANDAIWVQDLEGNIIAANQATVELSGFELHELIGRNVAQSLTPQGLNLAREIKRNLLGRRKIPQPYEQRAINKNGTEAIFMMTTSLLGDDGMPRGFQHIGRNITFERQLQGELCLYIEQITRAHEDERNRIARELHDDTIQSMIVISRHLDSYISKGNKLLKGELDFLEDIRQDIDNILLKTRRFIEDLRPSILQYLGLLPAVREMVSQLRKESSCDVKFNVKGIEQRFNEQEELLIYRICQEALMNIRKHSEATKVEVNIQFSDERTYVTLNDNGRGFKKLQGLDLVKTGKLGIVGMMERARLLRADLAIHSKKGGGTTIILNIPRKK